MKPDRHFTSRRGFIAAFGFGGVSLYGLWAAYGAAPNPLALFRSAGASAADEPVAEMAMAGHGGMEAAPDVEAFRAELAEFIDRFAEADGTVYPRPVAGQTDMAGMDMTSGGQAAEAAPGD
ncbi:MAG: hypothetical protein Q7T63_12110, partial [Burkholderiaceae bacterium]|nr:hypothetical protein [Burkholderiaceae bacterium]